VQQREIAERERARPDARVRVPRRRRASDRTVNLGRPAGVACTAFPRRGIRLALARTQPDSPRTPTHP
jgi:hypothetical protein